MVSAEGISLELPNEKSSVPGRLVTKLFRGPRTLVTLGTGTGGTGMMLTEAGSGRAVSSMPQEAAPLVRQMARQ